MKYILSFIDYLILLLYFLVFIIVIINKNFDVANIISLIIGLIICGIYFLLLKKRKNKEFSIKKLIIKCLILFICEIFVSYIILFKAGFDAGAVFAFALENLKNHNYLSSHEYISSCPNNFLLLYYYMIVAKLSHIPYNAHENINLLLTIINCLLYSISSYLLYMCTYKITDDVDSADFSWFLYVILVGSSPWVIIPYSDSLALIIPILCLFIYIYLEKEYILKYILLCLISFMSFNIKPQCLIVFIAICFIDILKHLNKKEFKVLLIKMVLVVVLAFISFTTLNYFKSFQGLDDEKRLGMTHYLMMGANYDTYGTYSVDDANFSINYEGKKYRDEANIQIFKDRYRNRTFLENLDFLYNKAYENFKDGTFTFGLEGGGFYFEIYHPNHPLFKILSDIFYSTGKYYGVVRIIRQAIWVTVLLLNVIGLFKKDDNSYKQIVIISLFGLLLFEMLFEARSRYLFIYVPFYILLASCAFKYIKKAST